MANTPSKGFYSNLGKLRRRWAWPPERPLDLLARIGLRTIIIALSLPFKTKWLHGRIFGEGEATILWRLLPPLYFLKFSND